MKSTAQRMRSVNLERDLHCQGVLDDYIPLPDRMERLKVLHAAILSGPDRAFSVTGPCGVGKSKDLLLVASALDSSLPAHRMALGVLGARKEKSDWCACAITADPLRFEAQVIEVLSVAFELPKKLDGLGLLRALPDVNIAARRADKVLLILDELSRVLEDPGMRERNLAFLQDLAEAAQRSSKLVLVGALHRGFSSERLLEGSKDDIEWVKVHGRFRDFPVALTFRDGLALLAGGQVRSAAKGDDATAEIARLLGRHNRDNFDYLTSGLLSAAPLAPLTAALLVCIARTGIGQSDRGIRDFLYHGGAHKKSAAGLIEPGNVWDWASESLGSALARSSLAHLWALATHCVERTAGLGKQHRRVAEVVGLIHTFGLIDGLLATPELIRAASGIPNIEQVLAELCEAKIFVYREYRESYDLFEGSDFNLAAAVGSVPKLSKKEVCTALSQLLDPVVASAHFHKTGVLRWFDVVFAETFEALRAAAGDRRESDGSLIALLDDGRKNEASERLKEIASSAASGAYATITLGAPLLKSIEEWQALEQLRFRHPAIQSDAVARRELSQRIVPLIEEIRQTLLLRLADSSWFLPGKRDASGKFKSLVELTSKLADAIYSESPRINSELLNRKKPSPSAVGARKMLCLQMLKAEPEQYLAIEKFPAERGLYDCLLAATGLHRRIDGSGALHWHLVAPSKEADKSNILPVWSVIEGFLRGTTTAPGHFSTLHALLAEAPYGLRSGIIPVVVLSCVLSMREKLAFYADGMFAPEISETWVETYLRDPLAVSVRYLTSTRSTKLVEESLESAVVRIGLPASTTMDHLKLIASFLHTLDPWPRRTKLVSPEVVAFRDAFLNSSDPLQLLQRDLPSLVSDMGRGARALGNQLSTLATFLNDQLRALDDHLRLAWGVHGLQEQQAIAKIRDRAGSVSGSAGELRLQAAAQRLATYSPELAWLESFAGFLANKPVRLWVDRDLDACNAEIDITVGKLIDIESYVLKKGPRERAPLVVHLSSDGGGLGAGDGSSPEIPKELAAEVDAAVARLLKLVGHQPWAHAVLDRIDAALSLSVAQNKKTKVRS